MIQTYRIKFIKIFHKCFEENNLFLQIDQLCRLLIEDLNSSIFTTRYFMRSSEFAYRAAGFFILGLPSFAVLPLLLYLIIVRMITEKALIGLCCTLVGVPVIAVCIAYGVAWYRNLKRARTIHNLYLECPESQSTLESNDRRFFFHFW